MKAPVVVALFLAAMGAVRFATAPDGYQAARQHVLLLASAALLVLLGLIAAPFRRARPLAARVTLAGALLLPLYTLATLALHGAGAVHWADLPPGDSRLRVAQERVLAGPRDLVWSLAFSPDGRRLASASVDGTVGIWSVGDGRPLRPLVHPAGVTAVAWSREGRLLATGSYDGMVRLWDAASGSLVRTLQGHTGTVWAVAFDPDASVLASGGNDTTVRLWSTADGSLLRTLPAHHLIVWSVAFSPDGERLASASFDHSIKIWRARDGTLERTLAGHDQAVLSVAFSPDGKRLGSGSDDKTVRLWRVADGALLRTLWGEMECVYKVGFSPDGRTLASAGRDRSAVHGLVKHLLGAGRAGTPGKTIQLWEVEDGARLARLSGHGDDVYALAISPDGRTFASSGVDGTIVLWSYARSRSTAIP